MQKDTGCPLRVVRDRSGKPLYCNVLEIQKSILMDTEKISSIRCVDFQRDRSRRNVHTDPRALHYVRPHPFIAVSCPWKIASPDHAVTGKYHIDPDYGMHSIETPQDVVLDRVIKYATAYDMPFWIDKLCIDQLEGCDEKKIAIQSMDLVYAASKVTVGLLFMRIDSREQVNHLYNLLSGAYVVVLRPKRNGCSDYELNIPPCEVKAVMDFIESIVKDAWWQRGWIFQEEYLSGTRMRLLIRSSQWYDSDEEIFGKIEGELEVDAVELRKAITEFCLACKRDPRLPPTEWPRYEYALTKAGRYDMLLTQDEQQNSLVSMSPTILQEIGTRRITNIADLLAIAANSCGYSCRLDPDKLNQNRVSLSLAILALCILNGEILRPDFAGIEAGSTENIFDFLSESALRIEPPLGIHERGLTFTKHCRFTDVKVSREGIGTNGLIWKLGKVPISAECDRHYYLPGDIYERVQEHSLWEPENRYCLSYDAHKALWRIQHIVRDIREHEPLANELGKFLTWEAPRGYAEDWSWIHFKHLMATNIARAFMDGKQLRLGCIWHGDNEPSSYKAIFVANRDAVPNEEELFAFTSWACGKEVTRGEMLLESCPSKYVSLEVGRPRLSGPETAMVATKSWMNGLCFFKNVDTRSVVVEWPQYLVDEYREN